MPVQIPPDPQRSSGGRDAALDIARGIGIVLVVFGHLQRGLLDLRTVPHADLLRASDFVLYTTHMPLFFLLAGRNAHAALRARGRRAYLASRPRAILWPYGVWSVLFVTLQQVAATAVAVHHPEAFAALLLAPFRPIGIFWFLQALFLAQLAAVALLGRAGLLLGLALAADLAATLALPLGVVPGLTPTLLHLPFFAFGFLAAARAWRAPAWLHHGSVAVPAACGTVGLGLVALGLGAEQPVEIWTIPVACLGLGTIGIVAGRLVNWRFGARLAALGRASMPIYVLHLFTLPVFMRAIRGVPPGYEVVLLMAGTVFGVAASLALFGGLARLGLDGVLGLSSRRPDPRPGREAARPLTA